MGWSVSYEEINPLEIETSKGRVEVARKRIVEMPERCTRVYMTTIVYDWGKFEDEALHASETGALEYLRFAIEKGKYAPQDGSVHHFACGISDIPLGP